MVNAVRQLVEVLERLLVGASRRSRRSAVSAAVTFLVAAPRTATEMTAECLERVVGVVEPLLESRDRLLHLAPRRGATSRRARADARSGGRLELARGGGLCLVADLRAGGIASPCVELDECGKALRNERRMSPPNRSGNQIEAVRLAQRSVRPCRQLRSGRTRMWAAGSNAACPVASYCERDGRGIAARSDHDRPRRRSPGGPRRAAPAARRPRTNSRSWPRPATWRPPSGAWPPIARAC